jgi:PBSX family phage terminase large subunit
MEATRTLSLNKYPKQAAFVSTSAHFSAFIGGIYSAKSYSGCIRAAMAAYGYIGNQAAIPTPNLGMITAPTYDLLNDATLRTFRDIAGDLEADFNKNEMRMTLQNGSEVLFRSTTEPEKRRGPALAWAMMDEAALSPAVTFDILMGRMRQHEQLGYLWVCSTPRGQNWIWQKFIQAKNPDYKLFRAKTRDNPYVAEEIIQAWEQSYVGDFARQELEGEFVAFEGLIYPEFSQEIHAPASFDAIKPKTFKQVVAGVDWGYTNPGVIVVFGVDGDGRMWGLHEEYRRQRRIEEWAEKAKELRDTYGINHFYCDPSEPDFVKAFVEKGCKAEGADNEVIAGIQRVKARLVKRPDGLPRILYPRTFVNSFKEYSEYQWKPGKGESFQDEPAKSSDHTKDAERYVVSALDGKQRKPLETGAQKYA